MCPEVPTPARLEARTLALGGDALVDELHEAAAAYVDELHPMPHRTTRPVEERIQSERDAAYNAHQAATLDVLEQVGAAGAIARDQLGQTLRAALAEALADIDCRRATGTVQGVITSVLPTPDETLGIPDAATHSFGPPEHCRTCGENDHTELDHPRSTSIVPAEVAAALAAVTRTGLGWGSTEHLSTITQWVRSLL